MNLSEILEAATLFTAVFALLVNGIFLWLRYRHDIASRNISASMKLVEEWRSVPGRNARQNIREQLTGANRKSPCKGLSGLDKGLQADAKSVAYLCDEIGARVVYGEANAILIYAFLGHSVRNLWTILEPYILAERHNAHIPLYQMHFEALARKAARIDIDRIALSNIRRHVGRSVYAELVLLFHEMEQNLQLVPPCVDDDQKPCISDDLDRPVNP